MDILGILTKSGAELYPEDLDFFETELATGGPYDAAYQSECRARIQQIRNWQRPAPAKSVEKDLKKVMEMDAGLLSSLPEDQRLLRTIAGMREEPTYKTMFKQSIRDADFVDADFVEKHFSFFEEWELNAILSVKELGEPFLEKYFGALDHDKIARYQHFSETFFMKHYAQMDVEIVLRYGKNEWRKKENRSKQLDVFLRLKGVKI